MSSRRILRVAEEIREHIASLLVLGKISDPRLRSVTIQGVKLSPDMQVARVYYTFFDDSLSQSEVQKGLRSAVGFVRKALGEHLRLRYTPEVVFMFDESLERAQRVSTILQGLARERDQQESSEINEEDSSE